MAVKPLFECVDSIKDFLKLDLAKRSFKYLKRWPLSFCLNTWIQLNVFQTQFISPFIKQFQSTKSYLSLALTRIIFITYEGVVRTCAIFSFKHLGDGR